MRKTAVILLIISLLAALVLILSPGPAMADTTTKQYGDFIVPGTQWLDPTGGEWDLTRSDLTIRYTLDMSGYVPPMWNTQWSGIGVGDSTGTLGWMSSGAPAAAQTNPASLDNDDKLNLGAAPARWDEATYDATDPNTVVVPPIGNPWANFGVWFDRDGVDQWQDDMWGMIDTKTYNTGGIYEVEVTFHAIDAGQGTMFAKVNGTEMGTYDTWRNGPPHHWPLGKSFTGDMTRLRVYESLQGAGVKFVDLEATGTPYWTPVEIDIRPWCSKNYIWINSFGVLPVAVLSGGGFDATKVDPDSALLAGAPAWKSLVLDVDCDRDKDLLLWFKVKDLDLTKDSTSATLTADTSDGLHVMGTDGVVVFALPF